MSQATVTNIDKAAVLLSRLAPQALDKVLEMMGPEVASKLRPAVAAVSRRKDIGHLTEQVLQEFRDLQQEVRAAVSGAPVLQKLQSVHATAAYPSASHQTATQQSASQQAAAIHQASNRPAVHPASNHPDVADQGPAEGSQVSNEIAHPITSETKAAAAAAEVEAATLADADSLSKIPPAILAAALKSESPRMIATVFKQLPTELSGKALEALPLESRASVFLLMADNVQINPVVVRRVLQRVLEVCRTVDPAVAEQSDRRVKTLIGVLQTVEREERIRLMESLAERDPDLASQVDNLMYDYMDILRIEDRSVQKLLGQLEQRVVATALKTAPEDLRQKVLKNLSERVRLALNEEMELLAGVNAAKADAARREIANVIRGQDKEGALLWIE